MIDKNQVNQIKTAFENLNIYEEYQIKKLWSLMLLSLSVWNLFMFYAADVFSMELYWFIKSWIYSIGFPILVIFTIYAYYRGRKTINHEEIILTTKTDIRFVLAVIITWFMIFFAPVFLESFFHIDYRVNQKSFDFIISMLVLRIFGALIQYPLVFFASYLLLKPVLAKTGFNELLKSTQLVTLLAISLAILKTIFLYDLIESSMLDQIINWLLFLLGITRSSRTGEPVNSFLYLMYMLIVLLLSYYQYKGAQKTLRDAHEKIE